MPRRHQPHRQRAVTGLPRIATATLLLLLAGLACSRGPLEQVAGRVTPIGTPLVTPSPRPLPTRATPLPNATAGPAPTLAPLVPGETLLYRVETGETLRVIAERFAVPVNDLVALNGFDPDELLSPDDVLLIPARVADAGPGGRLLPDSELVFSPGNGRFDIAGVVANQGGYLSSYREFVSGQMRSGAEIVARVAQRHSVNPRLLLAIIDHQSGWLSTPGVPPDLVYPLGYENPSRQGFFRQLDWLADSLNLGYYGWRTGTLTTLTFPNDEQVRIAPGLNAATVALQYVYSQLYTVEQWTDEVSDDGVMGSYRALFQSPFDYAYEPLLPAGLSQPDLQLPFMPGRQWAYTGGPHAAWTGGSPLAAIDFAPPAAESGCVESQEWVVAPADGLVTYSDEAIVTLDLDGDGAEQTGWVLFFLHIATDDRVTAGTVLSRGDRIGHPSCEGGRATGTHVHIARKYNGEWQPAAGPMPMVFSGWTVERGDAPYEGYMVKFDGQRIRACECGPEEAGIWLGR